VVGAVGARPAADRHDDHAAAATAAPATRRTAAPGPAADAAAARPAPGFVRQHKCYQHYPAQKPFCGHSGRLREHQTSISCTCSKSLSQNCTSCKPATQPKATQKPGALESPLPPARTTVSLIGLEFEKDAWTSRQAHAWHTNRLQKREYLHGPTHSQPQGPAS